MNEYTRINQVLDYGSNKDKINILESLSQSSDQGIINKIISKLDDSEIPGSLSSITFGSK